MIWLKQSTASQEIPLGYFLDSTDGDTAETALTIANTDIKLWKTGATTLANKNSGGATHISGGVYYATLDAIDTNTLGPLVIFIHVSGALSVRLECLVLPANTYDSLVAGSDTLQADVTQLSGVAQSATDLKDFADAGYDPATNKVQGVVLVDTTTVNSDMRGTDSAALATTATAILDRIGSFTGTGVNTILGFFQALLRSDGTTPSDAGGTFDPATDSVEAIRDRGDAAWTTGGGGSITDILNITPLIPPSIDLANTTSWQLAIMLINSLDDLPSTAEITPGTISIYRKAIGATSWTSVVLTAACSELAGKIYYDEVFDAASGYAEGDSIRIIFYNQKITVAANDYEISDANGRIFYTEIRQSMRGTDGANTTTPPTAVQNRQEMDSNSTQLTAIVADTNELQADDVPGLIAALPTANENADALLKRDWTAVTGEAARSVLNALRFLRNKWSVSGSTLTVTEEDDTTTAWTGTVTTDAAADPITGNDPV